MPIRPFQASRPEVLSFSELRNKVFPPETHIVGHGILHKHAKLFVTAPYKNYKSFTLNTIMIELLTGGSLFGAFTNHARQRQNIFPINPVKRILLLEQEMGFEDTRDRLLPYWQSLSSEQQDIVNQSLLIHSCNFRTRLDDRDGYMELLDIIQEHTPEVVIFDPLCKFHLQNENDPSSMNRVMLTLTELSHELDFTTIISHHHNKNPDARDLDRLRGATTVGGDLDTNFQLSIFNRKAGIIKVETIVRRGKPVQDFLLRLNPETLRMEFNSWYEGKNRGESALEEYPFVQ